MLYKTIETLKNVNILNMFRIKDFIVRPYRSHCLLVYNNLSVKLAIVLTSIFQLRLAVCSPVFLVERDLTLTCPLVA